ncbi:MAG: hypothetical protein QM762_02260 [Chryseolinea sp.]
MVQKDKLLCALKRLPYGGLFVLDPFKQPGKGFYAAASYQVESNKKATRHGVFTNRWASADLLRTSALPTVYGVFPNVLPASPTLPSLFTSCLPTRPSLLTNWLPTVYQPFPDDLPTLPRLSQTLGFILSVAVNAHGDGVMLFRKHANRS